MSHPFILLRGDCTPSCKTPSDADCTGLACDNNCIEDLRTVIACDACTCKDILNEPNCSGGTGSFGARGTFDDDFSHCLCPNADDHRSVEGTLIVTSITIFWHYPRVYAIDCSVGPDKLNETITQTIIDAGTCPDDPHSIWILYKAPYGTIVPTCPAWPDPALWTVQDLGMVDFLTDADAGGDILTLDFPVDLTTDPPDTIFFSGQKNCYNRPIPVAFLLVVSDACGHVMTTCPITVPGDIVKCPICELLCCEALFGRGGGQTTVSLCEDGSLSVHVTVIISCPDGICPCTSGNGTVTFQYPIGTAFAQTFSGGVGTYTFDQTLSCTDGAGPEVLIIVDFACDQICNLPNCPDNVTCPDSTGEMVTVVLGGSLV